jgi:hypothetical protein
VSFCPVDTVLAFFGKCRVFDAKFHSILRIFAPYISSTAAVLLNA